MRFDNLAIDDDLVIPPVDSDVTIAIRGSMINGDVVVPNGAWAEGRVVILSTAIAGEIQTYDVGSEEEPEPLGLEGMKEQYVDGNISESELEQYLDRAFGLNDHDEDMAVDLEGDR